MESETSSATFNLEPINPECEGHLKKWTNFILGWKSRYFVLTEGSLLYYKSQEDTRTGCRGAVNVSEATVTPHGLDEYRLDICVYDLVWYLRADSYEEREKWIGALKFYARSSTEAKQELGLPDYLDCRLSVSEKLREIKIYKDLLIKQLYKLQMPYCETAPGALIKCSNNESPSDCCANKTKFVHTKSEVDLIAEISTLKNVMDAFERGISECVDIIQERELEWTVVQGKISKYCDCGRKGFFSSSVGPELVEGEHCTLKDEEFFDAVESSLERIEEEAKLRKRLEISVKDKPISCESLVGHPLWNEISKTTEDQMTLACSDVSSSWILLVEEENLKLYSYEQEIDGLFADMMKVYYVVRGVTGKELCHYFFGPEYRKDWETTLEQMEVVDRIGENTMVFYQVYKRVWPAAQRDTLFWSNYVQRSDADGQPNVCAVVNKSMELPGYPSNDGRYVRLKLSVCLYCETHVATSAQLGSIDRKNISCRVIYSSMFNPGGWVPASAVRALSRKEYPRFLKKFTSYVLEQTNGKDVMI